MKKASLSENLEYKKDKPAIKVMLESEFTKEIRILFRKEHLMKKHKTPYPIVVEIVEGEIDFGVNDEILKLKKGDLLSLEGGIPHDLYAVTDSMVRLTLSKDDRFKRVEKLLD